MSEGKKLSLICLIVASLFLVAAKEAPVESYSNDQAVHGDILSRHETIATYQGEIFRECRGRTSRCPQTCGHSGDFATFAIDSYTKYTKPGKYGDPKRTKFQLIVPATNKALTLYLKGLKKGAKVELTWNHEYGKKGNSTYPIRVIRSIKKK